MSSHSAQTTASIQRRAVILTALPAEYQAVRAHLSGLEEETHPRGTVYERGRFDALGHVWEIGIVEIGSGNPEAALEAERAIEYFHPSIALFVGVAGGIKDVTLGDVVAATKVYGYESGKAEETFKARPDVGQSAYALEQRARAAARSQDWLQRLGKKRPQPAPRAFVGPIAAGEKVVASPESEVYKFLRAQYSDALAVEMEGSGFLSATHANHPVEALIVRGISDLIQGKGQSDAAGWQEIAARNASAFAFEVLAKYKCAPQSTAPAPKLVEPPSIPPMAPISLQIGTPDYPVQSIPARRNPYFIGREGVLADLEASLKPGRPAALVQAIAGLGGVGKTQLAVEYSYRHLADYDVIWWARAEEPAALAADYMALGRALRLPGETIADQKVVVGIVRRWLEATKERWLLVLDNADEPQQLDDYLPQRGAGHILVTSRNPNWGNVAAVLPVHEFVDDEARRFLLKRTGQTDAAGAAALAGELGYLPLALEQAGAYIVATGTSLSAYLKLFIEHRQELLRRPSPVSDAAPTVATTWELAFRRVQEASPAGAALLNLCAFLAPDDIPWDVLGSDAAELPPALATAARDPLVFNDALAALRRYSLVETRGECLSIHRLVQAVVRDGLEPDEARMLAKAAVSLMDAAFPFDANDLQTWEPSGHLLPHALAAAGHADALGVAPETTAHLWQQAGRYLRRRADFTGAQRALERAAALREATLGVNHTDTAESLDLLGELFQEQTLYIAARSYHERALSIRRAALGDSHPGVAKSLNNLGALLDSQGQYVDARPYYEQALAIRKAALEENHPDTATSLNNLGALLQAQGRYAEARPYCEQALAITKAALGKNHPDTATSLNNLGALLQAQGRYAEARPYCEQALAINKAALGENHPDTAIALNNLGELLQAQGRYAEARPYFEQALAITKAALGENHLATATILSNLGALLQAQGRYAEARPYFEQILVIQEAALGSAHPHVARSLNNLGLVLFYLRDRHGAQQCLQRALAIYEAALGPKHPFTIRCRNSLRGVSTQRPGGGKPPLQRRR